eukprot:557916-Alexandrium_andersonii.AAC.2
MAAVQEQGDGAELLALSLPFPLVDHPPTSLAPRMPLLSKQLQERMALVSGLRRLVPHPPEGGSPDQQDSDRGLQSRPAQDQLNLGGPVIGTARINNANHVRPKGGELLHGHRSNGGAVGDHGQHLSHDEPFLNHLGGSQTSNPLERSRSTPDPIAD